MTSITIYRRSLLIAAALGHIFPHVPLSAQPILDGTCTASVSGRTGGIDSPSSLRITNVPAVGILRVKVRCEERVDLGPGLLSLQASVDRTELVDMADSAVLTVVGVFSDGTVRDLSQASTGTRYFSANQQYLTVDSQGTVKAIVDGASEIFAINSGWTASVIVKARLGPDTDGDGLTDTYELSSALDETDPLDGSADLDGDGLTNRDEFERGTDPNNADSDGDGFSDFEEMTSRNTNPLLLDSDFDGLSDTEEISNNSDPDDPRDGVIGPTPTMLEDTLLAQSDFFVPVANGTSLIQRLELVDDIEQVVSIGLSPSSILFGGPGETSQVAVLGTFASGLQTVIPAGLVAFSSFDPTVCQVDGAGVITAISSGACGVTALYSGVVSVLPVRAVFGQDADGDGLPDEFEINNGCLDPGFADGSLDFDSDGLSSLAEFQQGTDPCSGDTDGDGLNDGEELGRGTNGGAPDTDVDGILDGQEVALGSDPLNSDSDGDGVPDGIEFALSGDPFGVDPLADIDGDGLSNLDEVDIFTDPGDPDTDDDGLTDGEEVLLGSDPLVPEMQPPTVSITMPQAGDTLTEGQTVLVVASASDDVAVASVDFLVDGQSAFVDTSAPYEFSFQVPQGKPNLFFGARASDIAGNIGIATEVAVSVVPDPRTTVTGRTVDDNGAVLPGADVTCLGLSTQSDAAGAFSIVDVPTVQGRIFCTASTVVAGESLNGFSTRLDPVPGGTTDVGDIALSPLVELSFISNNLFDIAVIDVATRQVLTTIDSSWPTATAISADGRRLYISNQAFDNVGVLDIASNQLLKTIAVGNSPQGLEISPDGSTLYVANFSATGTVSVIDTGTDTVVDSIDVGQFPRFVAFAPDGTFAYVTNRESNTLRIIDTATRTQSGVITVGSRPAQLVFSSDGTRAYVSNFTGMSVSVIDTSSHQVIDTIPVSSEAEGIDLSPDDRLLYVAHQQRDFVSVIDTQTNTVTGAINVGIQPWAVAFTRDGTEAFTANQISGDATIIDVGGVTVSATIDLTESARQPSPVHVRIGRSVLPPPIQKITFNEFPIGTAVDDEYRDVGAVFSSPRTGAPEIVDAVAFDGGQASDYASPPNALWIPNPPLPSDVIDVTFVDPSDGVTAAFVTQFSIAALSDSAGVGGLVAFDQSGVQIDSVSSNRSGNQMEVMRVYGPEIWSVRISGITDLVIDEVTFSVPTP